MKKLQFNSPVILSFFFLSLASLLLGTLTGGISTTAIFSVYRSSLLNPRTYIRFVGHVFGHANTTHFFSNMLLLLVVGPPRRRDYDYSRDHRHYAIRCISWHCPSWRKRRCIHVHHDVVPVRCKKWTNSYHTNSCSNHVFGAGSIFHFFHSRQCCKSHSYCGWNLWNWVGTASAGKKWEIRNYKKQVTKSDKIGKI